MPIPPRARAHPALAWLVPFPLVLAAPAWSQETSDDPPTGTEESRFPPGSGDVATTIVTATKSKATAFETPYATDVVDAEDLRRKAYRTTPQALRDIPGVMVQETAHGQGSPFIRGLTGFLNVMLVDGIRLNNSVFRSGPNQYWNTIDAYSIDRIEVVKGPSSVLYGSDAVGGTVNAITKTPYTYGAGTNYGGLAYYRIASAEESHIGRIEGSASYGEDWGVLLGASGKHFGDLQGGRDLGTQPETGYDEWDVDFKGERFLDEDTRLVVAYQHVFLNDVPRTHKTVFADPFEGTTIGSDLQRDLDQRRELAYVQLHGDDVDSWFDSYSVSLSWHDQEEERNRIKGGGSLESQGFDVETLGFFSHLSSDTDVGRLTYGVDVYHDSVDSFKSDEPIQGPVADDATYDLFGAFVQDEIELSERLSVILGARFNYAAVDAKSVLDPVTMGQIAIDDEWSAVVGSARFTYELDPDRVNLFGGISQGFRAPNLSDLTRLDSALTNEFEIPSPGLDPEYYTNFELGVKTQSADTSTQVAVFYTDIRDGIIRVPTGATTPAGEDVVAKANVGDGYVVGIEAGAAHELRPGWTVFGNGTFIEGKQDNFPTAAPVVKEDFFSKLMPLTLQAGIGWEAPEEGLWAEAVARYADDGDRLSPRDENDTSRIPPGGTPDYLVFDLRGGYRITDALSIQAAVENVTDEDYRIHGSGQNMPGRNFVMGLTFQP